MTRRRPTGAVAPCAAAVALMTAALLAGAAPGARAADDSDLAGLRNDAITAYNAQNYGRAATLADHYLERASQESRTGREVAALQFILGHSRYEVHQKEGGHYGGDYRAEVVQPLEESLRVLQDDAAFKNMLLGNAWHVFWSEGGRRDAEAEGRGHWHLLKSILLRDTEARDHPRTSPEYDQFARHVLFYLERCLEYARTSESADLYRERIRAIAPLGFGTAYDARFWQIHDLTWYDDGNMKAAALWQRGLDSMRDPKSSPDEALASFTEATELTRRRRDKAEVYRQMADFVSTLDAPQRRQQAAEFARRAYELNPGDAEIRRQYGTALHVLSYASYASGKFDEAYARAQEAITFEWTGMETALFDLSRSAAEMGKETDALTHGERAYRMAREKLQGSALQPFAQNYVNVLRQFGQEGLAARVQMDNASLGVH
jgi:tetratricopeptide (TPR) repeat protein